MKRILQRAAALLLSAAVLLPSALASEALGGQVYGYTLDLCAGTALTRQVMWSASRSDLRTENYVTYTPNPAVSPKVSYGDTVLSKQTVQTMAQSLEADGERVLSGVNGDYFVMATGNPLGLVVTDGVLRSSASYLSAIGFRPDGSAVAGKPDLTLRADFSGYSLKIAEINKVRSGEGYFLFSSDFGPTTLNTRPGIDVILSPVGTPGQTVRSADGGADLTTSRQLGIGKSVPCQVEEVLDAEGATPIPPGKFVLSVADTGGDWLVEVLSALQPGDPVNLEVYSADARWNEVDCALGSLYHILSDGQVTEEQDGSDAAPRTAVGVKADGSVLFYTIDGRLPGHSVGASTKMVAQRLAELGCTEGMLLDGGGSTTFVATYPDRTAYSTVNQPSGGAPRAVTNALFLVSNLDPTGTPGSLYVAPDHRALLPGASTACSAAAIDTGWHPLSALPGAAAWSADQGTVSADGVYTAPQAGGTFTVTAACGGLTGSTQVNVFDAPDAITLTDAATGKTVSALALSPGQTVDLNAAAAYRKVPLQGGDNCFTWSCDPAVGSITVDGRFTAGPATAQGTLRVAAGQTALTWPVSVSADPAFALLADFETDSDRFFDQGDGVWTLDDSPRFGRHALRWTYTPQAGTASLTRNQPVPLDRDALWLSFWVYGDRSGNTLFALFPRADGSLAAQTMTLNFTGWKRFCCDIPRDAVSFQGLKITGETGGEVILDQFLFSNQSGEDSQPPAVSLTVSGTSVTARLTDNARGGLDPSRVTLFLDGQTVPFTLDGDTLTASLPDLGESTHQITVTAADLWGNLGRASRLLAGTAPCPFSDMDSHWAAPYAGRLQELGIVNGTGGGQFSPNSPVTRGDFALMAARWLGLDLTASRPLPFADADAIPAWDRPAVAALAQLGILRGSAGADGQAYANATASITRAEAFTLLSRMQAAGWREASLSAFSDAGAVPDWARSAVGSLVGQQVVSGSGGQLRPNDPVSRAEVCKLLVALW